MISLFTYQFTESQKIHSQIYRKAKIKNNQNVHIEKNEVGDLSNQMSRLTTHLVINTYSISIGIIKLTKQDIQQDREARNILHILRSLGDEGTGIAVQ